MKYEEPHSVALVISDLQSLTPKSVIQIHSVEVPGPVPCKVLEITARDFVIAVTSRLPIGTRCWVVLNEDTEDEKTIHLRVRKATRKKLYLRPAVVKKQIIKEFDTTPAPTPSASI